MVISWNWGIVGLIVALEGLSYYRAQRAAVIRKAREDAILGVLEAIELHIVATARRMEKARRLPDERPMADGMTQHVTIMSQIRSLRGRHEGMGKPTGSTVGN